MPNITIYVTDEEYGEYIKRKKEINAILKQHAKEELDDNN